MVDVLEARNGTECSLPRLEAVDDPVDVSEETVFLTKGGTEQSEAVSEASSSISSSTSRSYLGLVTSKT